MRHCEYCASPLEIKIETTLYPGNEREVYISVQCPSCKFQQFLEFKYDRDTTTPSYEELIRLYEGKDGAIRRLLKWERSLGVKP